MAARLTLDPQGVSTVVNLTTSAGKTAAVFKDPWLGNLMLPWPATITAKTDFWVADDDTYALSAKQAGVEKFLAAGGTVKLAQSAPVSFSLPGAWASPAVDQSSIPDTLSAAYASLSGTNLFTGLQNLHGNGQVMDSGGNLTDTGTGATFYRVTSGVGTGKWTGGTNGPRGDSIASDVADGAGATFFNGFYCNVVAQPFDDKGVAQMYSFYGTLAPYSGGGSVYGEIGGVTGAITNNRTGGRAEGFESAINAGASGAGVAGRNAAYVAVVNEFGAPLTYWSRAYWASSQGSSVAGDAFYADGTAGWTNFEHYLNAAGSQVWRVDATGKLFIGAGARNLYDDGTNLHHDGQLVLDSLFSGGAVYASGFFLNSDSTRQIVWGSGSPNGVVVASPGSIYLSTAGGATTTLYVKESGVGTNTGWVAK